MVDNEEEKTKAIAHDGLEALTTNPVVYSRLSASIRAEEVPANSQENLHSIASELLDSVEAGREGIGIALTYAMHQLSQRPSLQVTLRNELMSLKPPLTYPWSQQSPISTSILRELDRLPLLEAVVTETLRLHVPAPGPQRRAVPEGGTVVEGYFIPAGVTISSSPYSMHRHEGAYPEANVWKPERWMETHDERVVQDDKNAGEAEKGKADNPRRWFWAFGNGGKMCLGSNFSIIVLKLLLASIYTNFDTVIVDDKGIEQRDDMMAYPVGDELILMFKHAGL